MRTYTLEAARKTAGLTQAELGRRIGVSRVSIWHWEHGRKEMTRTHYLAFLRETGFEEDEIRLPEGWKCGGTKGC